MTSALDLEHLRTFTAIDEFGGFGRAADALALSQSTVSQHVRALEKVLRRPLVRKDGRRSVFTPAGGELLLEARRILAVHDTALGQLLRSPAPSAVLGVDDAVAAEVLGALRDGVGMRHPDRTVTFRIDRSRRLSDDVVAGAADLAVVLDPEGTSPGRRLGELPLSWYAAPAALVPEPSEGILPVVADTGAAGLTRRTMRLLVDHGHRPHVVAEASTRGGVTDAVRAGLGIAALSPGAGGLRRVPDLPDPGSVVVRLEGRPGADWDLAQTVADIVREIVTPSAPAVDVQHGVITGHRA